MPILYTGNGDTGSSVLVKNGPAISKSAALMEALGALDEVNSFLGLCKVKAQDRAFFNKRSVGALLHEMQNALFTIQAEVVTPDKYTLAQANVTELEEHIAQIEQEIPPVTAFCIAGGTELAALFDIGRTLARRAERAVIRAIEQKETTLSPSSRAYLNRLSSILYALARYANHQAGAAETHPTYLRRP